MENKLVPGGLIELCLNIKKIVEFWNCLPKSRRPASKSYNAVLVGLEDPLTTAKLAFCSYLSSLLELYLNNYQMYKPMAPFVYQDKSLDESLLKLVTNPSAMKKCKSGA